MGTVRLGNEEVGIEDSHLVFGQRAGLVGTYHRCRAHGLASMHLAHEVIGFEHTTHRIGQTKCHRHRQSLGNRYDYKRHGQHHRLKQVGDKRQEVEIIVDKIHNDTSDNDDCRQQITDF